MEVPSKNGKPIITNEMKVECMGEFQMAIQTGCLECMGEGCESCDGTGDAEQQFDIPWTLIKDIYKRMAVVASHNKKGL